MFELAGLSAFLDILQKGFGLIDKRKDQKRRLFEEIVEPIHTELRLLLENTFSFSEAVEMSSSKQLLRIGKLFLSKGNEREKK